MNSEFLMSVFVIILQLHHEKGAGDMRRPQKSLGYRSDEDFGQETFLEGGCTLKLYRPLVNGLFFRSEIKNNAHYVHTVSLFH